MSAKKVMKMIEDENIKFIDFRFTDTIGKEQHVSVPAHTINVEKLEDGQMFDGSSIAGWKTINDSDMILSPDTETAVLDPFTEEVTLNIRCNIIEPSDLKGYVKDPRSIAYRAEEFMKASGVGDTAYFGNEPEFFVFDSVKWDTGHGMGKAFYEINSEEAAWNSGVDMEGGNKGHRPGIKGGYFPVPLVDSLHDLRSQMCLTLEEMGVPVEVHHHEVAGSGQNEIGTKFSSLTERADWTQILKYVVMNTAHHYGKTATFMPKPFGNLTGNGCHAHISLWNGKINKFLDNGDRLGLSRLAYNFLGGIMKLTQPLTAFFNPTINSYRRINAPPTKSGATWSPSSISYTGNNRTHMIRVPDKGRFELRLMDGAVNPYLLQAGVIAAGLHGINNKIDPGEPLSCNMYTDHKNYPNLKKLPNIIEDALDQLENSKEIEEAFGSDTIKSYLKLKRSEIKDFNQEEKFDKKSSVTHWEKNSTLDC